VPPPKISKVDPPELPEPDVPKLELAPVPLVFEGGLMVELKEEVGAVLPELDDPELPDVLPDCENAASGHERAMKVAIRSRLEIMEVVEEFLGQKRRIGRAEGAEVAERAPFRNRIIGVGSAASRSGAGNENRTRIASLEGWSFTIKLCPHWEARRKKCCEGRELASRFSMGRAVNSYRPSGMERAGRC
jgi:hypothetical protein